MVKLSIPESTATPSLNYREVDWKKLNETLSTHLPPINPGTDLTSIPEFQQHADDVMKAIQTAINQHIPHSHPSPHLKRWWMKELTDMKKDLARMA